MVVHVCNLRHQEFRVSFRYISKFMVSFDLILGGGSKGRICKGIYARCCLECLCLGTLNRNELSVCIRAAYGMVSR